MLTNNGQLKIDQADSLKTESVCQDLILKPKIEPAHVFSQKDNPRLVLANTSGRVAVVIEFPSFYSGQLMWFTPDKVAHA